MAYRIFNMVSDKSYRVRLASMTYTDTLSNRTMNWARESRQDLTNALLTITGMQWEILNIPAETPGLTSRERDTAARYLRGFFKDVRNLEK